MSWKRFVKKKEHGLGHVESNRKLPKVSVISPCYNHGKFILEMLKSVFDQTYSNYEVIIVNDGSTDDTKIFLDVINDYRVHIFHTENMGPAAARNLAIRHASGEIICNLDADDKIEPSFIEKCVNVMMAEPNVGIVYSLVQFFGARNELYQLEAYSLPVILTGNVIVANACFRRSDWEKTDGYASELLYGCEDYDFWLSIIELGRSVHRLNEVLVYYRTHEIPENSRSGRQRTCFKQIDNTCQVLRRRHPLLYEQYPEIRDQCV